MRFTRLRRLITAVGVFVIIAFAASSACDAWRTYDQTVAATDRELSNLARALAEQGARSLQTVDVVLRDTARWYSDVGHTSRAERIESALSNRAAGLPQVHLLAITDASGIQRHSSIESIGLIDVSDRSYFISQRTGTDNGFFVSEPLVSRGDGRSTFVVSRRLTDSNGIFAGVVTAAIDIDDLQQFYGAFDLGKGSAINVVREDGTLVVRHPPAREQIGRKFPELALAPAAHGILVNTVDGQPRYAASVKMRDLPLVVTVTREQTLALQSWRSEAISLAVRTLVGVLLVMLAIAALLHQLRRAEAGETALRESEERYALAMEGANEGHWDWDLASDRLFMSPKMKVLAGLNADTPISTRAELMAYSNIHPDDMRRLDAAVNDHTDGKTQLFELEYRVRHADGEWHWALSRGRALRDANGTPYRFVGSAIDVTARKRAEDDKERLEAQLRQSQKMEAMGTLAGGIAHDFNNILGAILGYGELAQKNSAEGTAVRRYLDNVMHAASRAKLLVERILGFSRSGLSQRAPVNIQAIVEETLELLAASLPPRVRLVRTLDCGNAAVVGDPTQLQQVAMNLFTNALQAMERGGTLRVELDCVDVRDRQPLTQGFLVPGAYVRLVVSDTGAGIEPATLERMFDPFFTTKAVGEGTGLGLSVVHGIVADLGGAIEVATEIGHGTTFSIWLPRSAERAAPSGDIARDLPRGQGESVMVIDDERALVALAEEMLAELGYEPAGFQSSTAALHAFRADPLRFDVVLTDETMPDIAGTEVAREINRLGRGTPILLMSGYAGKQLADRARAAGVTEVLRKPLVLRDIAEALARVLLVRKRAPQEA
ncbi:MAG: ATP-binding protein [Burkholderiales bacterium]